MKKYIAVLEIEDNEEIIDAKISYIYSSNGMNYKATERMELKEESENAKNKTYEDGLNEAWEIAGRIDRAFAQGELVEIFGYSAPYEIIKAITPKKAIEKINEYDNRNVEVGDEVEFNKFENSEGKYGVLIDVKTENKPCGDVIALTDKGEVCLWNRTDFIKTGRKFPQIEEILNKLKEKSE